MIYIFDDLHILSIEKIIDSFIYLNIKRKERKRNI